MRNRTLDVLKGLAMLMVIINHMPWTAEEMNSMLMPFWVRPAVPIFLVISGYLYAMSFEKRGLSHLEEGYDPKRLLKKELRFLVPFTLYFVLAEAVIKFYDIVCSGLWEGKRALINELFFNYLSGKPGAGTYYTPVMLQFVILIPILHFIIKKYDRAGFLACGGINLLFEILKTVWEMNQEFYRMCALRYIFIIAFGVYLAIGKKRFPLWIQAIAMAVGGVVIYAANYTDITFTFINYWTDTSMFAAMFVMPGMGHLIRHAKLKFRPLEYIGKISYDIYLSQGFFVTFLMAFVHTHIFNCWILLAVTLAYAVAAGSILHPVEDKVYKAITARF